MTLNRGRVKVLSSFNQWDNKKRRKRYDENVILLSTSGFSSKKTFHKDSFIAMTKQTGYNT